MKVFEELDVVECAVFIKRNFATTADCAMLLDNGGLLSFTTEPNAHQAVVSLFVEGKRCVGVLTVHADKVWAAVRKLVCYHPANESDLRDWWQNWLWYQLIGVAGLDDGSNPDHYAII